MQDDYGARWPWLAAQQRGTGFEGFPGIADEDLRPEYVPSAECRDWDLIVHFAFLHDVYSTRTFEQLADLARSSDDHFFETGSIDPRLGLGDLRALLVFEQRKAHWLAETWPGPDWPYISALLTAIRAKTAAR